MFCKNAMTDLLCANALPGSIKRVGELTLELAPEKVSPEIWPHKHEIPPDCRPPCAAGESLPIPGTAQAKKVLLRSLHMYNRCQQNVSTSHIEFVLFQKLAAKKESVEARDVDASGMNQKECVGAHVLPFFVQSMPSQPLRDYVAKPK